MYTCRTDVKEGAMKIAAGRVLKLEETAFAKALK
jgi:hypothetical protein